MTLRQPVFASAAHLERIAVDILEVVNRLREGDSQPEWRTPPSYEPDLSGLASIAKALHYVRSRRSRYLPHELLGEPAWDMLLDLFVQSVECRAVSVTSATHASGSPCTTALRHLGLLQREGLVERQRSSKDQRVSYLVLTDKGRNAMIGALCETVPTSRSDPRARLPTSALLSARPR